MMEMARGGDARTLPGERAGGRSVNGRPQARAHTAMHWTQRSWREEVERWPTDLRSLERRSGPKAMLWDEGQSWALAWSSWKVSEPGLGSGA